MVIVMNGEHGGSFSAGLTMEWAEEGDAEKIQFRGHWCSANRSDRDDAPVNWGRSLFDRPDSLSNRSNRATN